jgi:hypothetical protein
MKIDIIISIRGVYTIRHLFTQVSNNGRKIILITNNKENYDEIHKNYNCTNH